MSHMKQGHAAIFASFLQHRVTPVTEGVRKSFVVWFNGEPFTIKTTIGSLSKYYESKIVNNTTF